MDFSQRCFQIGTNDWVLNMAISNELSSEIAAAILSTGKTSSVALEDLKRVVEQVHETLEQMANDNRAHANKTRAAGASGTPLPKLD